MGYTEIQVDVTVHEHFNLALPHIPHKWAEKFSNPIIEKVWADRINHHEVLYQVHVKTGHFPHHHHFTVLFEVRHGHVKVLNVVEGHNTLF
jgi:hypothetical protein